MNRRSTAASSLHRSLRTAFRITLHHAIPALVQQRKWRRTARDWWISRRQGSSSSGFEGQCYGSALLRSRPCPIGGLVPTRNVQRVITLRRPGNAT
jgi:hypothetical protein